MAVIALAAIYAQEAMKFTTQQTIVLILVVNITAAVGAFGFGYLQDAIGHIRSMLLVLVGWIVMITLAYVAKALRCSGSRRTWPGFAWARLRLPAARSSATSLRPAGSQSSSACGASR
jgi:UMF1 family MFS transporter